MRLYISRGVFGQKKGFTALKTGSMQLFNIRLEIILHDLHDVDITSPQHGEVENRDLVLAKQSCNTCLYCPSITLEDIK